MRLTMIGHSTVLLEIDGLKVLTDPYFGTTGNPAFARPVPPARSREDLLDVDLVLVSHAHWDHADRAYLRALAGVPVVVPGRARVLFQALHGPRNLVGMDAWEERRFGSITVTAVPAVHSVVTAGFVIHGEDSHVYFAGDTYHRGFMAEIGRRFPLDVALMPVTTYRLPMTMGEVGAVDAVRDLRPAAVVPIHLGITPRLPLLRGSQSPARFADRLGRAGLAAKVVVLDAGESWSG